MSEHEGRSPGVVSAPTFGFIEGASTADHGTDFGDESMKVIGARSRDAKRHGVRSANRDFNVAREIPVENFGDAIVAVGNKTVERH